MRVLLDIQHPRAPLRYVVLAYLGCSKATPLPAAASVQRRRRSATGSSSPGPAPGGSDAAPTYANRSQKPNNITPAAYKLAFPLLRTLLSHEGMSARALSRSPTFFAKIAAAVLRRVDARGFSPSSAGASASGAGDTGRRRSPVRARGRQCRVLSARGTVAQHGCPTYSDLPPPREGRRLCAGPARTGRGAGRAGRDGRDGRAGRDGRGAGTGSRGSCLKVDLVTARQRAAVALCTRHRPKPNVPIGSSQVMDCPSVLAPSTTPQSAAPTSSLRPSSSRTKDPWAAALSAPASLPAAPRPV